MSEKATGKKEQKAHENYSFNSARGGGGIKEWFDNFVKNLPKQLIKFAIIVGIFIIVLIIISISFASKRGTCFEPDTFTDDSYNYIIYANGRNGKTEEEKELEVDKGNYYHEETTQRMKKVNFNLKKDNKPIIIDIKDQWIPWFGDSTGTVSADEINSSTPSKLVLCPMKKQVIPEFYKNQPVMGILKEENEFQYIDNYYSDFRFKEVSLIEVQKITTLRNPLFQEPCWLAGGLGLYIGFYGTSGKKQPTYFHHLQANHMVCNAFDFLPSNNAFISNYSKVMKLTDNMNSLNLVTTAKGRYLLRDFIKENFSVNYFKNKDTIYNICVKNPEVATNCQNECGTSATKEFNKTVDKKEEELFDYKVKKLIENGLAGTDKFLSVYKNYIDYEALKCLYEEKKEEKNKNNTTGDNTQNKPITKLEECISNKYNEDTNPSEEERNKTTQGALESLINNYILYDASGDTTTVEQGAELSKFKATYNLYKLKNGLNPNSLKIQGTTIEISSEEASLFQNLSFSLDKLELKIETATELEAFLTKLTSKALKENDKYGDQCILECKADDKDCSSKKELNFNNLINNLCWKQSKYNELVKQISLKANKIISDNFLSCIISSCSSSKNKLLLFQNNKQAYLNSCIEKHKTILNDIYTRNQAHISFISKEGTYQILDTYQKNLADLKDNNEALENLCNEEEQKLFLCTDNKTFELSETVTNSKEQIRVNKALLEINLDILDKFLLKKDILSSISAKSAVIITEINKWKDGKIEAECKNNPYNCSGNVIVSYYTRQAQNIIKDVAEFAFNSNSIIEIELTKMNKTMGEFKKELDDLNAKAEYRKEYPIALEKKYKETYKSQIEEIDVVKGYSALQERLNDIFKEKEKIAESSIITEIENSNDELGVNDFLNETLGFVNSHIGLVEKDLVPVLFVYLTNIQSFKEASIQLAANDDDYYKYKLYKQYNIFQLIKNEVNISDTTLNMYTNIIDIYRNKINQDRPNKEIILDDITFILDTYGKKESSDSIYKNYSSKDKETGDVLAFKENFEFSPLFSCVYKRQEVMNENCIEDSNFKTFGTNFSKYTMQEIDRTVRFPDPIDYGKIFSNFFLENPYNKKHCTILSKGGYSDNECSNLVFDSNGKCTRYQGLTEIPKKLKKSTDDSLIDSLNEKSLKGVKLPITIVVRDDNFENNKKDVGNKLSIFSLLTEDFKVEKKIKNTLSDVQNDLNVELAEYLKTKCGTVDSKQIMSCCIEQKEIELNKSNDIGRIFLKNDNSNNSIIYDMEKHEQALIEANVKNIPQILVKAQNAFYNACYKEITIKKDNDKATTIKNYLSSYRYDDTDKIFPILKTYNNSSGGTRYSGEQYSFGEIPFFTILDKYYNDNQGAYNLVFKSGFSLSSMNTGGKLQEALLEIEYKLLGTSRPGEPQKDRKDGIVYHVYHRIITDSFRNLARAILALFVILKGYYIIFGLTKIDIKELMILTLKISFLFSIIDKNGWDFYNKTFINFFINSTIGFIDLLYVVFYKIFDEQNNLQAFISTTNILAGNGNDINLSKYFVFLDTFIDTILSEAFFGRVLSLFFYKMPVGIIFLILLVKATIGYLNSVITMIINYISILLQIAILLPLAPIFLLFMLFKQTFRYFKNWVSYLMSRCVELIAFFFVIFFSISLVNGQLNEVLNFKMCIDTVFSTDSNGGNSVFSVEDLEEMQGASLLIKGLIEFVGWLAKIIFGGVVFYIPVGLTQEGVSLFQFILKFLKLYFLLTMFGELNTTITSIITKMFKFKIDPKDKDDKGDYKGNTAGDIGGKDGGFLGALGNQTGLDSETEGGGLAGSLGMGGVLRSPSFGGAVKVAQFAGKKLKDAGSFVSKVATGEDYTDLDSVAGKLAKRAEESIKNRGLRREEKKAAPLEEELKNRNRLAQLENELKNDKLTAENKQKLEKEQKELNSKKSSEYKDLTRKELSQKLKDISPKQYHQYRKEMLARKDKEFKEKVIEVGRELGITISGDLTNFTMSGDIENYTISGDISQFTMNGDISSFTIAPVPLEEGKEYTDKEINATLEKEAQKKLIEFQNKFFDLQLAQCEASKTDDDLEMDDTKINDIKDKIDNNRKKLKKIE